MLLNIFGFLNISFADILDILMVAIFIYLAFRWIRGSAAMNIFIAVILLFVLRVVVAAFNMKLMNALLGTFIDVGVIALIVIFQPEVRHFLMKLGSRYGMAGKSRDFFNKLMGIQDQKMAGGTVNEIAEACRAMSADRGADRVPTQGFSRLHRRDRGHRGREGHQEIDNEHILQEFPSA